MRHRRLISILLAATMTIGAGSTASSAVLVKGTLTSSGYRWRPASVSIVVGTKVTWTAVDGSHTVTAYRGPWSKNTSIAQGTSTSFTFRQKGTYRYRCKIHSTLVSGVCSGMCGKVVVG